VNKTKEEIDQEFFDRMSTIVDGDTEGYDAVVTEWLETMDEIKEIK